MNLHDLIEDVSKNNEEIPKQKVKEIVDNFLYVIKKELGEDKNIKLRGFGSFEVNTKKPTKRRLFGREFMSIPEKKVIKFYPSKPFIKYINSK